MRAFGSEVHSLDGVDFVKLFDNIGQDKAIRMINPLIDELFDRKNVEHFGRKWKEKKKQVFVSFCRNGKTCYFSKSRSHTLVSMSRNQFKQAFSYIIRRQFIQVGNKIYRQKEGCPMGGSPSPIVANLVLFLLEELYITSNQGDWDDLRILVLRFLDDVFAINAKISDVVEAIYQTPTDKKLTTTTTKEESRCMPFLDINIKRLNFKVHLSTYDKRDAYGFDINKLPHYWSNIHDKTIVGTLISQFLRACKLNDKEDTLRVHLRNLAQSCSRNKIPRALVAQAAKKFQKRHAAKFYHRIPGAKKFSSLILDQLDGL